MLVPARKGDGGQQLLRPMGELMKKRGKILRDTSAGAGLLMAEGQQYPFSLEGVWRSEEAPRVGMVADVELNERGEIVSIATVPESQLAREQAEVAMAAARERGAALASGAVARFGIPSLVGAAALIIGWWMLPAVSVNVFGSSGHITFWQVLGFVNAGNLMGGFGAGGSPSTGIYGLLAVVAVGGPFVHHFCTDRRASLGALLPLLFMLLVGLMVRNALAGAMGGGPAGAFSEFANQARDEAMKAVSIGSGVYISLIASLYFAVTGTMKFMAARATDSGDYDKPRKVSV